MAKKNMPEQWTLMNTLVPDSFLDEQIATALPVITALLEQNEFGVSAVLEALAQVFLNNGFSSDDPIVTGLQELNRIRFTWNYIPKGEE